MFEYPCGVAPGFDPKHVAGSKVRFSGIARDANAVNILTGLPGASPTLMSASIHGNIGPCTVTAGNGAGLTSFSGMPAVADSSLTVAAIFVPDVVNGTFASIFQSSSNNSSGVTLSIFTSKLFLNNIGGGAFSTNVTPVAGTPYFFAMSESSGVPVAYVITNLAEGSITSGTTGTGATPGASTGTYRWSGFATGASSFPGRIAAAMYSSSATPLSSLQQWAADPWSFWYPGAE